MPALQQASLVKFYFSSGLKWPRIGPKDAKLYNSSNEILLSNTQFM